jgi:hypothetical protein
MTSETLTGAVALAVATKGRSAVNEQLAKATFRPPSGLKHPGPSGSLATQERPPGPPAQSLTVLPDLVGSLPSFRLSFVGDEFARRPVSTRAL